MRAIAFVCLLLLAWVGVAPARRHHGTAKDRLAVTLYYEALCPYCMAFVTTQLAPSMLRMNRLPFTDLNILPFGNAKHDDAGNVVCQHGTSECELNAWHGCILEHHSIAESLKLIGCMMRGKRNRLDKCAKRYQIDVGDVKTCKSTRSVNDILAKYGEATSKVHFAGVPAIALDNVYDENESEKLSENFDALFCAKYRDKFHKTLKNCEQKPGV
ncbi:hypothetical protein KR018_010781 [Drosophila ironensis]|nr:hypothetical protein KR018_010781 [Drosophila ironensis]